VGDHRGYANLVVAVNGNYEAADAAGGHDKRYQQGVAADFDYVSYMWRLEVTYSSFFVDS